MTENVTYSGSAHFQTFMLSSIITDYGRLKTVQHLCIVYSLSAFQKKPVIFARGCLPIRNVWTSTYKTYMAVRNHSRVRTVLMQRHENICFSFICGRILRKNLSSKYVLGTTMSPCVHKYCIVCFNHFKPVQFKLTCKIIQAFCQMPWLLNILPHEDAGGLSREYILRIPSVS